VHFDPVAYSMIEALEIVNIHAVPSQSKTPKSLSQEAAAAGYVLQKEKSCQSIKAFLLLHKQSCCQTKRVGMKILSVVGTTQSCFHTERVGMKILSAIGAARSLALARWGFTKAMASGPWATQAKPQLPKNILCPQGKRYDERARECRQSAQAKGG